MSERSDMVDDVARAHGQFARIKTRFAELEAQFNEIGKPTPTAVLPPPINRRGALRAGPSLLRPNAVVRPGFFMIPANQLAGLFFEEGVKSALGS